RPAQRRLEPERALRLEAALRRTQASSGLFHTLLLDQDSYQETAGSALILHGMARGVRLGFFGSDTRQASLKGARGLLALLRRDAGKSEVTGTSLGTNPIAASYRVTPTADQVSYGVGAWLMAASELLALLRGPQGVTGLTAPLSRDYSATARRAVEAYPDTTALLPVLQG